MAEKTFYEILEIRSDAPPEEVGVAYERLSARPASKEQMDALAEAFQTLSDPLKRAKYDMSLEVREKPASEQIEAVAPMWTMRTIVAIAVFVVLAGVAYYFYEENEAREEAERAVAATAAAKVKEAEARAKVADQETMRREDALQSERNERDERTDVKLRRMAEERRRQEAQEAAAPKRKTVKLTKEEIELMNKNKGKVPSVPGMPPGISIEMK